jgi:Mor family transcriptional regulator
MAKHGVNNFDFQIIEMHEAQSEANDAECFWISFFGSRNPTLGYNLSPGGDSPGCGPDHPNYGKPAPNRLFTDEQEKEICSRYTNEVLTITQLAEDYSCNQSTIHKMLQRHGVEILGNPVHSKGKRYSPETEFKKGQKAHNKLDLPEDKIVRLYVEEKLNTTQLGKMYSCARTTIISLLNRLGIEMRKKCADDMSIKRKMEILEDYHVLQSSRKVAKKYGMSRKTVMKIVSL